jgi:hypothetical protein
MNHSPNITPSKIVAVINDLLVPGIQFQQATRSGAIWILIWSPTTDRLYKWDCPSQLWVQIRADAISESKKKTLAIV